MATVRLEDGSTLQVPDGSTPDQVQSFVDQAKSLNAQQGQNGSAPSDPGFFGELFNNVAGPIKAIANSVANTYQQGGIIGLTQAPQNAAFDMVKGALSDSAEQGKQVMDAIHGKGAFQDVSPSMRATSAIGHTVGMIPVVGPQMARMGENFTAGNYGAGVADLLPLLAPEVASRVAPVVPSVSRATKAFNIIDDVAGHVPVNPEASTSVANRIIDAASRSNADVPKIIQNFMERQTKPNAPPMNYTEARDFASNAGSLSVADRLNLAGPMKRLLGEFSDALHGDIRDAAEDYQPGLGDAYDNARWDYKWGKRVNKAAGATVGTYVVNKLRMKKALDGLQELYP